jgi:hypothetical protein
MPFSCIDETDHDGVWCVVVLTTCPKCKESTRLYIPESEFTDWQNGQLIQRALKSISKEVREQLISGYCPTCWLKIFPPEGPND